MSDGVQLYRAEVLRTSTHTDDVGDWVGQEPDERHTCFICGARTDSAAPEAYVEVDVRYSAPAGVLSVGAHTQCLREVASERSAVAQPPETRSERREPRSGLAPVRPPVSFPVYGVAVSSWPGPRWFDDIEGEWGQRAYAVTLKHGTDSWPTLGASPWLSVESVNLDDLPDSVPGSEGPSSELLARRGLFHLVNQVPTPEMPPKAGHRFWRRVLQDVDRRTQDWQSWDTVSWTLDGSPVQARMLGFGGGWTAFVEITSGSGVVVNGAEIEPAGLELQSVVDGGSSYAVDLTAPITADAANASRLAALGEDIEPDWDASVVHPDMLAMLDTD